MLSRETLEHTFNMDGAFNDVSLLLTAGADQREIIAKLDTLLDEYGGQGAYGRDDQPSHVYLNNEIQELSTTGTFIPTVFLAVTAFLLNLLMTRFVSTQREQIAVLKAFGYANIAVGWHYLKFVFLTISFGGALGVALGIYIGSGITDLYAQFFRFPLAKFEVGFGVLITSVVVSTRCSKRDLASAEPAARRSHASRTSGQIPGRIY